MPTYLNSGTRSVHQAGVIIDPSASLATTKILETSATLTKTAATPYFNPYLGFHAVTAAGAGDETVTLTKPMQCKVLRFQKISADITITVYFQAKANTPAVLTAWASTDPPVDFYVDGQVDTVIITFSAAGSCQVVELEG